MKQRTSVLVVAAISVLTVSVESQQVGVQSSALPPPIPREPSWAFQVQGGSLPAESDDPKSIPGSTRKYTPKQIDDLTNPPDSFPDKHPPHRPW